MNEDDPDFPWLEQCQCCGERTPFRITTLSEQGDFYCPDCIKVHVVAQ
jgi:hypothetical protein